MLEELERFADAVVADGGRTIDGDRLVLSRAASVDFDVAMLTAIREALELAREAEVEA